ncbi:MAG: NAD-dependent epimerase/dehydratase family protein [Pseudomonadota bacterium]|nr:NAD-dependent epimerase/dehydratase family protein [Pseudomonadota bacterium]
MEIKEKKFLVIGGAGLIGSHTVDKLLLENPKEIIIFDNFVRGLRSNLIQSLKDPRVTIYDIGGDICQTDILNSAVEKVDGVFHLAALWLLQCHEYPSSAFEVNIKGTFNVLDACTKNQIERLVYSSSASVYGDALEEPMGEDHPFNNKNFYGATKICGESMARAFHHRYGLNYVGLRYMNVYGPRQDYQGAYIAVIMKMLDAIDRGEGPTILGDGSEAFDFVSVEDCARANVRAMKATTTDEFYNVGTGSRTTLKELAEMLLELTESTQPISYKERSEATLVRNRIGSPEKAAREINFVAEENLRVGLEKLIRWRNSDKEAVESRRKRAGQK